MKNSKNKRIAVILLSLIMMLTMMPSAAFGAGEDGASGGPAAGAETGNTAGTENQTAGNEDTDTAGETGNNSGTDGNTADATGTQAGNSDNTDGTSGTGNQTAGNEGTDTAGDNTGNTAGSGDQTAGNADTNGNAADANGTQAGAGANNGSTAGTDDQAVGETEGDTEVLAAAAGDSIYPDGFTMSIPVLKINVTKGKGKEATETGKAAIDAMNASDDHSYKCTGTMDVEVPDGFKYADQAADTELRSMTGLKIDYIRGRGNSTWAHEGKRPYKVKLKDETSLLGMQANKHWALIANAFDPSMMRNRITYWIGRELNMEFTPEAVPVDVFIGSDADGDGDGKPDGYEYYGCYLLTHIPKNYVKINEPAESVTDGIALTGGYLMSMMQKGDTSDVFVTRREESIQNILPSYDKEIDEDAYDNETQKEYIRKYVQEAEDSLFDGEVADDSDPSGYRELDYHDYFDMYSAALYWMMQFFTDNGDAYSTGSSYFYKTRDTDSAKGKIYWGPLWDFDFAWNYGIESPDEDTNIVMGWMVAMLGNKDGEFIELSRDKWNNELRPALVKITENGGMLDKYYAETVTAQGCDYALNHEKYSRTTDEGKTEEDLAKDYKGAVEDLRDWINKRIIRMDRLMGQEIEDFSHAVYVRSSKDDKHPQVFYVRNNDFFRLTPEDPPEKPGYIFLGYYTDDTDEELQELCIRKDTDATAKYVKKEDATKLEKIYFARNDVCKTLETKEFTPDYKCFPEDAQDKTIIWTSSDESVATVDKSGVVTFIKEGKTVITARLSGGTSKSYNLTITNDQKDPEKVIIEGGTIYLKPGEIGELKYRITPSDSEYELYIQAEDDEVVYADEYGLLYAKKQGRTRVKVTAEYFVPGKGEDPGDWKTVTAGVTVVVTDEGGSISTDVEADGISGSASNLAEVVHAVLTDEEKERLAAGENVRLWLSMKALGESAVPGQDRQILSAYREKYGLTSGQYMDLSLFKKIGDDEPQAIHDSVVPVKFDVNIPDGLKLKGADANGTVTNADGTSTTRTFYLVRVHDGAADCVAKGTGSKLECASSLYSTYQLTYRDETGDDKAVPVIDDDSADAASDKDKASSSKSVKTGDETFLILWIAVLLVALVLGFVMLIIYKKNLDKRDKSDRE